MDTTLLNFHVLNQLLGAAGTRALTVVGNVTINIVSGNQENHNEHHDHTLTGMPASMPAKLDAAIRQDKCLRDVLGILLVLNPAESATVSLVAEIIGRSDEEVDTALGKVARHVKRGRTTDVALCGDIRWWLTLDGLCDLQEYHETVARWALSRTSSHPLADLYAAEQWHYHITRSRPSHQLYDALGTSMAPYRVASYKSLPSVVQWLRDPRRLVSEGLNAERDAVLEKLEGQIEYLKPRLKKLRYLFEVT